MKIVKLKDIAKITTGKTPSKNDQRYYTGGTIPFIKPPDLGRRHPVTKTKEYLNETGGHKANLIPKNSIMVSCIGLLGKVGIAGVDLATNQQINSITFDSNLVDFKYGYYFSLTFERELNNMANKAVVPIVNKTTFSNLDFPLPPLEEQKRIVRILDQADSLRQKRQKAISLLDDYLKAVFLEMFGGPVANPKNWEVKKFDEIIADIGYGSSAKSVNSNEDGTIPILRIPNILNGYVNYKDLKFQHLPQKEAEKLTMMKGDILFVRTNGNPDYIGRCAVYENGMHSVFASYLIRVRFKENCGFSPKFIRYCLSMDSYRGKIRKESRTTAGNYNINTKGIKNFDLISPPLEKQEKFIDLMRRIEQMKELMKTQLAQIESNFGAHMQSAFIS